MREQCDQLAVLIISGRPLIITDLVDDWDALIASWLPGTEGQGIADVLFGLEPFTGTLPYTWPRSIDQIPIDQATGTGDPLYSFGYGLPGD
jgi:beta-glucosidase